MNTFLKECRAQCKSLGDYETLDITDVANKYCEAVDKDDQANKEKYFAVLALRFWGQMTKFYAKVKNNFPDVTYGDLPSIFLTRLNHACKYRAWQNPDKKTNAKACINQAINTEVQNLYYDSNLDKNKANFNAMKLDSYLNDDPEDAERTLGDLVPADYGISGEGVGFGRNINTNNTSGLAAMSLVQSFINNGKYEEAIIIDTIAFEDTVKRTKATSDNSDNSKTQNFAEFSRIRTAKRLREISDDYVASFKKKYTVNSQALDIAISSVIASANNSTKIKKKLDQTLNSLRANMYALI